MLECVINISEGRDTEVIARIAATAGDDLLDVHSDPDHNRTVLTVVGAEAPRSIARSTAAELDLRSHRGVHPRIGVLDVVPFVAIPFDDEGHPLAADAPGATTFDDAIAARDDFARWITTELRVPVFLYGPLADGSERTLPELRRGAFDTIRPDLGPIDPHPSAGAVAVGARPLLVAWNLWLADDDLDLARRIAAEIRGPGVRTLGLQVGSSVQVSMNLTDPLVVGPAEIYDRVTTMAAIEHAELVGLVPDPVVASIPPDRRVQLDCTVERTIGARLTRRRERRSR